MTRLRTASWAVLLSLAALAAGCARTGPSRPVPADRVLDFATLYGQNCSGCHGADGQFGPAPPLNDPVFLAIVPDAVLLQVVAEGRPGTPMPAFARKSGGTLTDEQVRVLAGGIKTRWKASPPEIAAPSYLAEEGHGNRARGARAFEHACASCHGDEGRGGKDKVGPVNDPAFLALISDQAIRRYIITGRRDLKMPNFAGKEGRPEGFRSLTAQEVADLVDLFSGWRRGSGTDRTATASPR